MSWINKPFYWVLSLFDNKEVDLFKGNQHIEDYLDYYIKLDQPPMFAVLIKGKWGSGKTWFIEDYLKKIKVTETQQIIKVSLYGLNSINDINAELFRELHPGLSSIKSGFLGKIITSASNSSFCGVTVDLSDFLPSGTYNFKEDKEYIIIFDDFERSHIEHTVLIGYLNQFVEIHKQKLILIADETKIGSNNARENSFKYEEIKEKLIGKTFTVKPNLEKALHSFLEGKDNFFDEQRELIVSTYQKANHDNLRHLKQAIDDFQRVILGIDEKIKQNKSLITQLFELFLIFTIEIKAGKVSTEDISKIQSDFSYWYKKTTQRDNETKDSDLDKFTKKYSHIRFHSPTHNLLSPNTWNEILDQNNYDFEQINNELLAIFDLSNIPDWKKIIEFWSLTDQEYLDIIKQIDTKLNERAYKELGEIQHIWSILLFFSNNGIYPKTAVEILDDAKKYIDDITEHGYLNKEAIKPKSFDGLPDSCCGYQFISYDTDEFNELKKYIESKFSELSVPLQKEKAEQLVKAINIDKTADFFDDKSFDFDNLPFLQFISVPDFVSAILSKPTYSTRELNRYLTDRYKPSYARENTSLLEELGFINACLAEFTKEKNNNRTLSQFTCEHFINLFSNAKQNLESIQIENLKLDETTI